VNLTFSKFSKSLTMEMTIVPFNSKIPFVLLNVVDVAVYLYFGWHERCHVSNVNVEIAIRYRSTRILRKFHCPVRCVSDDNRVVANKLSNVDNVRKQCSCMPITKNPSRPPVQSHYRSCGRLHVQHEIQQCLEKAATATVVIVGKYSHV
jgi:hypothetical protein